MRKWRKKERENQTRLCSENTLHIVMHLPQNATAAAPTTAAATAATAATRTADGRAGAPQLPVALGTVLHTLFEMVLRYDYLFFVEYFTLDLTMEDEERCLKCMAMCVEDSFIHRFGAQSTILVTDRYGRCYLVHICAHLH